MWRGPGVHRVAVDTDRQVTLECESPLAQVAHRSGQLAVQFVLQPQVIGNLRPIGMVGLGHAVNPLAVKGCPIVPACEIGGAGLIALHAKHRVGHQPIALFCQEFPEGRAGGELFPVDFEDPAGQRDLRFHHFDIVHVFERVEPFARGIQVCGEFVGHGITEIVDSQIDRVQREHADCRIRIGILPIVRRGGVVDRQNLDEFQANLVRPIGQFPEIRELAHAKTQIAAQGKHRDGHARRPIEIRRLPPVGLVLHHRPLPPAHGPSLQHPVRSLLQTHRAPGCLIEQSIFVFDAPVLWQIQVGLPDIGAGFPQRHRARQFPIADFADSADQAGHQAFRHRRHAELERVVRSWRHRRLREQPAGRQRGFERIGFKSIIHRARRTPGVRT